MADAFGDPGKGTTAPERARGDAEERAEVPRDQWDRYRLPHLDGTKTAANKGFTRVSTIKSGLSNQTGIKIWTGEKIVDGLAGSPEAITAAMKAQTIIDPIERKRALRKIADQAFVAGGGKERSGRGTNFHAVTEELNRGDIDLATAEARLSEEDRPSLRRYYEALDANHIQILPQFLERQVLCPYNAAGTFDNIVRWWNPDTEDYELMVGDLKTGRSLDLAWLEILIQLWMYANAYALWNTADTVVDQDGKVLDITGHYEPMPAELRKDKACIIHVPLDGTATVYILDLGGVQEWVEAAVVGKRANAEAKHKVRRLETSAAPAFVAPGGQYLDTPGTGSALPLATPEAEALALDPALKYHPGITEQVRAPIQYPTPDAQAQADLAQARLAKLNELAIADGRNDETDEPQVSDHPYTLLDGVGKPLGPMADKSKKERGCGVCGRKGHKSLIKGEPNPVCLGDNDPAIKAVGDAVRAAAPGPDGVELVKPTMAEVEAFVAEPETSTISPEGPPPGPPVITLDHAAPAADVAPEHARYEPEVLPYCHLAHAHDFTSTYPGREGEWVCAKTGKVTREVWEKRQTEAQPIIDVHRYLPPPAPAWPVIAAPELTPAQRVAADVEASTNHSRLATVRQQAIEAGAWTSDLEAAAWKKYQELTG